jgi:hypothetical protein
VGGYATSEAFAHGHCFPDRMVADRVRFLLQGDLVTLRVVDYRHVVSMNI